MSAGTGADTPTPVPYQRGRQIARAVARDLRCPACHGGVLVHPGSEFTAVFCGTGGCVDSHRPRPITVTDTPDGDVTVAYARPAPQALFAPAETHTFVEDRNRRTTTEAGTRSASAWVPGYFTDPAERAAAETRAAAAARQAWVAGFGPLREDMLDARVGHAGDGVHYRIDVAP